MKNTRERLERQIVAYMQTHSSVSMPKLSAALKVTDDRIHGRQHYVSQAIERLRRRGLIGDVGERCLLCTRAKRNRMGAVILELTVRGSQFGKATALPAQRTLREMTDIMHGVER